MFPTRCSAWLPVSQGAAPGSGYVRCRGGAGWLARAQGTRERSINGELPLTLLCAFPRAEVLFMRGEVSTSCHRRCAIPSPPRWRGTRVLVPHWLTALLVWLRTAAAQLNYTDVVLVQ